MTKRAAPNTTFAVVGNGGSLSYDDLQLLNVPDISVLTINDAWQWAPWAWAMYGADYQWWEKNADKVREFAGRKFAIDEGAAHRHNLEVLPCEDIQCPLPGLSTNPKVLRHGYSGGFQGMQIARAFGAKKILLLGFDYGATGQSHGVAATISDTWSDFNLMIQSFKQAVPLLNGEGIRVINCTRATSLNCFECMSVEDALRETMSGGSVKARRA